MLKGVQPFDDGEIEAISKWCKGRRYEARDRLLLMLLCHCALRACEARRVTIGQVYQHGQVVDAFFLRPEQSKGGYGEGWIALHKRVKFAIIDYLQTLPSINPDEPLLRSQKGGALGRTEQWRIINKARKDLGITKRIGTHSGRKYLATKTFGKKQNPKTVQGILRHRSTRSQEAYIDYQQDEVRRAFRDD